MEAASFTVNPTQILLSGATRSALLTLKNDTSQPLRFQVTAAAWRQTPAGQMVLEPTEDVVFFPTLLTLGPAEERKVRIGLAEPLAPGPIEKSYRVFVEELPALDDAKMPSGVTMRTRMGIPIFVGPSKAAPRAQIESVRLEGSRLSFSVVNPGNVHFIPESVRVRGVDATGAAVTDQTLDAWYILAGGRRDFDLLLPPPRCAEIRSLVLEAQVLGRTVKELLQTPAGACARQ